MATSMLALDGRPDWVLKDVDVSMREAKVCATWHDIFSRSNKSQRRW